MTARLLETLERIAALQPAALADLRGKGIVFDSSPAQDAQGWKNAAFWLYSYLCEADSFSRAAIRDYQERVA